MKMYAIISKIQDDKNIGLYSVETSYGDLKNFFITINLQTKIVSFFEQKNSKKPFDIVNVANTVDKVRTSKLLKDLAIIIGKQASKAIKQNSFPDSLSTFR